MNQKIETLFKCGEKSGEPSEGKTMNGLWELKRYLEAT